MPWPSAMGRIGGGLLAIFLALAGTGGICQTITGKITNTRGEAVRPASLLVKDSVGAVFIREFGFARDGTYRLDIKGNYQKLVVEVKALHYNCPPLVLERPGKGQIYTHDFILVDDTTRLLQEVVVTSQPKFKYKSDTLTYDLASYTDGTERKIQDILKKLPGIEVNETTGEIRFKGRSVEAVTLDGDDLFGHNYALGTKNIGSQIVESVQAIENYSANPVLKNIEKSGKVALNIQLKKLESDYSGDINLGAGALFNNEVGLGRNLNATLVGVAAKYKSFGMLASNNVGANNSTFDYFKLNQPKFNKTLPIFQAVRAIPEAILASLLDEQRGNINNQNFFNYNFLLKPAKNFSTKINLNYLHDLMAADQRLVVENQIFQNVFSTSDDLAIRKQPRNFQLESESKFYDPKHNFYVEYRLAMFNELIRTKSDIVINDVQSFTLNQISSNSYATHAIQATKKVGQRAVAQFDVSITNNRINQTLVLADQAQSSTVTDGLFSQQVNSRRQKIDFNGKYLLAKHRNFSIAQTIGGYMDTAPISAQLSSLKDTVGQVPQAVNNLSLMQKSLFYLVDFQLKTQKIKLNFGIKPQYLTQQLTNKLADRQGFNGIDSRADIILQPRVNLVFKSGNSTSLTTSVEYSEQAFSPEYLYPENIFLSQRGISRNIPELRLQRLFSQLVGFNYLNLLHDFQANASLTYSNTMGNFIANNFITDRFSVSEYSYLANATNNLTFSTNIEKYMSKLALTAKVRFSLTHFDYYNYLNASTLRKNEYLSHSTNFFLKSAFKTKLNFETDFTIGKTVVSSTGGTPSLSNTSARNVAKIIFRPARSLLVWLVCDANLPNLKKLEQNFVFIDVMSNYDLPKKNWGVGLNFKNVLNTAQFVTVNVTDFSTRVFSRNLLPFHFMFSIRYNF